MIRDFKFKVLGSFIAFVFILPIVTAFCCCTDFDPHQSRQEMLGHNHESQDHGSHHHGNDQEDKTTPESCECGNEILANLVNRTTIDFSAINTHFSKLQNDPIFQFHVGSALQATQNAISFHATGPPGSSSATPLYLQISVLRIWSNYLASSLRVRSLSVSRVPGLNLPFFI